MIGTTKENAKRSLPKRKNQRAKAEATEAGVVAAEIALSAKKMASNEDGVGIETKAERTEVGAAAEIALSAKKMASNEDGVGIEVVTKMLGTKNGRQLINRITFQLTALLHPFLFLCLPLSKILQTVPLGATRCTVTRNTHADYRKTSNTNKSR